MSVQSRPAFYALTPGGWRDYVTLLHPPYTAWHLGYVVIGAALPVHLRWGLLGLAVLAFFLAMGVGAHALDELNGRPLATRIPARTLQTLAFASIAAAVAIGAVVAAREDLWLLAFVAFGGFVVTAYNLELFGGRFHSDLWFALSWGSFPVLTAYVASTHRIRADALALAAFAGLLSFAQRRLSTPVRAVRRRTIAISGAIVHADGTSEPITGETLTRGSETALRALAGATVALAGALVLAHGV